MPCFMKHLASEYPLRNNAGWVYNVMERSYLPLKIYSHTEQRPLE